MGVKEAKESAGFTKSLAFAIFTSAFGSSFLFGYNLGVMNSPQTILGLWVREINCTRNGGTPSQVEGESTDVSCSKLDVNGEGKMFENSGLNTIWVLINSMFAAGALVGALLTSVLVGRFGRKGTLFWNSITGIISAACLGLASTAGSYELLIVGVNSGIPPLYFTEIAPASLRGALGSVHQLFITIAIWTSQILGMPYILGTSTLWPILVALSAVPAVYQMIALPFCPESPKFLFEKSGEQAARKALEKLRNTTEVDDELKELRDEYEASKDLPTVSIPSLFRDPFLRKVTLIAAGLMVCQQLSGIDAVMFYSTSIFRSAGLSATTAMFATIGMGAVNVGMTFVSVVLVEKAGRRTLLLVGYCGMSLFIALLTISNLLYSAGTPGPEFSGTPNSFAFAAFTSMICVIAFVIMFATGPGSIPWFLVAELFEQGARPAATTVAVGTNRFCSLIITLTFPLVQVALGEYTFLIFVVLLVSFIFFTHIFVIETKGKSTEQIQRELRGDKYQSAVYPTNGAIALTKI
ncbi:Glucose transporter type 1 [Hypsibius exemplaris]|uniref:Glucose transporter type 1 n=1 Tax=Hypsibius exemplaris TaxID=2072580 RepID=A0A9X6NFG6_HYPEX|nr:Glucose transporter type 1 [Hypsibius exemplaris]